MMLDFFFLDFFTTRIRYFTIIHHLRSYIAIDIRLLFPCFIGCSFELRNSQTIYGAHCNDILRYVIDNPHFQPFNIDLINTFFQFWIS